MSSKEEILANLIDEVSHNIKKKMNCSISECGNISLRDLNLIEFIGKEKKTMGEISDELNLTPGTITPIVDKMISEGFLQRERDEDIDRRKVFISIDKKGKELYDKLMESKLKIAKLMLNSFNKEEKEKAVELMKMIAENLK